MENMKQRILRIQVLLSTEPLSIDTCLALINEFAKIQITFTHHAKTLKAILRGFDTRDDNEIEKAFTIVEICEIYISEWKETMQELNEGDQADIIRENLLDVVALSLKLVQELENFYKTKCWIKWQESMRIYSMP